MSPKNVLNSMKKMNKKNHGNKIKLDTIKID